jgi:hypothetical protein
MDAPASPPGPDGPAITARLAALERQMRDMRRDLDDTLDLIERLRVTWIAPGGKSGTSPKRRNLGPIQAGRNRTFNLQIKSLQQSQVTSSQDVTGRTNPTLSGASHSA